MDILFVATELAPYVKSGGLADAIAALGKTLRQLGHKVTVAMPRFPGIEQGGLLVARRLTPLAFDFAGSKVEMTVYDGRLASGVELILLDAPGLFDRPGIYADPRSEDAYPDNLLRFSLFSKGVAELARQRANVGTPFDVVHAHDWPTALVPVFLRETARMGGPEIPCLLTIHDLSQQGIFPGKMLPQLGLDAIEASWLKQGTKINLLQGGIRAASRLSTVSTSYALEIQTDGNGEGLEKVLASRKDDLVGITNGIDYSVWNPATDSVLVARYDAEDASNKERCKTAILRDLELPLEEPRPLVVHLGMSHKDGTDLVSAAMGRIIRSGGTVIVAGEGDPKLAGTLQRSTAKHAGDAVFIGSPSDALVHRLLAAADIVLVPTRFEPAETMQLRAQRYGALPVGYSTFGLRDTIVDCDAALETGTGILFEKATAPALVGATQRAMAAVQHPRWPLLRRRIMRLDLGWDRPARRYEQLYRSLLAKGR